MKTHLSPYLFFDGNCREAMEFYKSVFGGKLEIMTFADMDNSCPAAMKDKVMHTSLMGGEVEFFGSDGMGDPLGTGKICMTLHGNDEEKIREMFTKLAQDGTIRQSLERQVWGDIYGDIVDKYNVTWMFNIGTEPSL